MRTVGLVYPEGGGLPSSISDVLKPPGSVPEAGAKAAVNPTESPRKQTRKKPVSGAKKG